jgi:dihydrofolate reductase
MANIILYIACSFDGYIARGDGNIEWLSRVESEIQDYGYQKFYRSVDALIMGRKTYQQILGFGKWPYSGKPCYVMSRNPIQSPSPEGVMSSENPEDLISTFSEKGPKRVWLVGGAETLKTFLNQELVHEVIVSYIPLLLGDGIPLFQPGIPERKLSLLSTETFPNGLLQVHYRLGD